MPKLSGNPGPDPAQTAPQCTQPPPLEDWQLLASLDRAADHEVFEHLRICDFCSSRASALAMQQRKLKAGLYRADCPQTMVLGDFELGRLDPSRAREVREHISQCPHCARELADLRRHLHSVASDIEWTGAERVQSLVGRIVDAARGTLTPGAVLAPALAGLRGTAEPPLLIEGDGVLLTLAHAKMDDDYALLLGQLAVDDQDRWTGAVVEIQQAGERPAATVVDDLGAFLSVVNFVAPLNLRITPGAGPDFQAFGISLRR